jgi:uncharacterized membrane protein
MAVSLLSFMQTQLHFSNEENQPIIKQRGWIIVLLILFALYVAFRIWRLTATCLWFDEIFSVHAARHSFGGLFSFVAQDLIHPPLFYLLLKIWISIGGESLLWLRLFPVLFAVVAVIPFWCLCSELRLPIQTIALAFFFLTINGSLIKYAQEVRMYSLMFCLSLFSLGFFVRFFKSYENKTLIFLSIINLLLIYTHYFGWLVVVTEIFFFLFYAKEKRKEFFISIFSLILLFVPWVFAVIKTANTNAGLQQNIGWMTKPTLQSLFDFALMLNQPFYFQSSSNESAYLIFITPPIALICFAIVLSTAFRRLTAGKEPTENDTQSLILLLFVSFLPVAITFIASNLAPYSFWGARHLVIVFAPFAILAAVAIQSLRQQILKDTALYLIIGFVCFALFGQAIRNVNRPIWCAWEQLAQQLNQTRQPVKIYASEELIAYHLWFVLNDSDRFQIVALKNLPDVREDAAYFLPRGFYDVKIQNADSITDESFWFAFRETEWNPNKQPLKFFVDKGYEIEKPQEINAQGLKAFLVPILKK